MRFFAFIVSGVLFVGLLVLGWGWRSLSAFLASPSNSGGVARIVEIPADANLERAIDILRQQKLASPSEWLDVYVTYLHERGKIQPGEYSMSPTMTPVEQIELIESGSVVTYTISVEAGMTARQVVELLGDKKLGDPAELLGLIEDRTFARSLGIDGPSLEGYLYPDIYDLPRGLSGRALLERFVQRFRASTKDVDFTRSADVSEYETIIIASLVETAAVLEKERRFYAALLVGRMREGIAIAHKGSNAYGRAKLPEDATPNEVRSHDWNTTFREGLPVTPIASPSLSAIKAAANPTSSQILYMAPRDDGTNVFCPDIDCYVEAFRKFKGRNPRSFPTRFR